MKNKYTTYLFDWDGTVVNTHPAWEAAWNGACLQFGLKMNYKQASKEIFGKFESSPFFENTDSKKFLEVMYVILQEHLDSVELNQGVKEFLNQLKIDNIKSFVVTSSQRSALLPLIEKFDLSNFFEAIFTSDDVQNLKPHPEILYKAMDLTASEKNECVIIGDSSADILAGQAAGIDTILYAPVHNSQAHDQSFLESLKPTHIVKSFEQLLIG